MKQQQQQQHNNTLLIDNRILHFEESNMCICTKSDRRCDYILLHEPQDMIVEGSIFQFHLQYERNNNNIDNNMIYTTNFDQNSTSRSNGYRYIKRLILSLETILTLAMILFLILMCIGIIQKHNHVQIQRENLHRVIQAATINNDENKI